MHDPRPDERMTELGPGMGLFEKKNGLCLTTDALLLAAFCRGKKGDAAVEFGCGSGAVSLLLARRGVFAKIVAVERDEAFYDLACRNVERNEFSDTVMPLLADVRELSPARLGFSADVVLANPPYFDPAKSRPSPNAERRSARQATAGDVFDFAAAAARCLRRGGRFFLVWRPDRLSALFAALRESGLEPKRMVTVAPHRGAAPSLLLTEAAKGGGEGLSLLPTLFLRESAEPGAPETAEAAALFAAGAFPV